MCNRAGSDGEPESLTEPFGAGWLTAKPMEVQFNPKRLYLDSRTDVVGEQRGRSGPRHDALGRRRPTTA